MKIKLWQKCLLVAMMLTTLLVTFIVNAFALPIDQLSRTEYFLPYKIEFIDTSSSLGNIVIANLTTVSNQPNGDVLSYFNLEEDDIYITKELDSNLRSLTEIYSPTFTFDTVKFYFKDFHLSGSQFDEIFQVTLQDVNGDQDININGSVSWNEQYYDRENNYDFTVDHYEETFTDDLAIIALAPSQYIEHTEPIEETTITDYVLTVNGINFAAFELLVNPISQDSIAYGVNLPPSVIPQVVNPNVIEWLTTSLNSFMSAEIFGNGITIGTVLGIAVAAPLVIWFLKLLAGG